MKTQAAVLWNKYENWSIETIELDAPKSCEVLVEIRAAGLCHTDDHFVTGDMAWPMPFVGGHEGAGIVSAVGPEVRRLKVGDHVVLNFMPICGTCPSCTRGRTRLCDRGAQMGLGLQISDGTSRHHAQNLDLYLSCVIGTFARHTVVHEDSCIVIDDDIPFEVASLLSCGVVTGWGSTARAGDVRPGDAVAVVGVGGLGSCAIQGARLAGANLIIAIDPIEFKLEKAMDFGATHVVRSLTEAKDLIQGLTKGQMCSTVVMTMGVGDGTLIADAMLITAKGGKIIATNAHPQNENHVNLNMADLTIMEKSLIGCVFGGADARTDIPMLIDLYRSGQLLIDELITSRYALEEVNVGYSDLHAGKNIRGVLVM